MYRIKFKKFFLKRATEQEQTQYILKTKNNIWIQNIHILFVKQVRMISVSYLGAVQTQIETIVVKICVGRVSCGRGRGGTRCAHTRFKSSRRRADLRTHTYTLTCLIYDILKNCFKLGRTMIVSYFTRNITKLWEFFHYYNNRINLLNYPLYLCLHRLL